MNGVNGFMVSCALCCCKRRVRIVSWRGVCVVCGCWSHKKGCVLGKRILSHVHRTLNPYLAVGEVVDGVLHEVAEVLAYVAIAAAAMCQCPIPQALKPLDQHPNTCLPCCWRGR
jgi:hypothetical protein